MKRKRKNGRRRHSFLLAIPFFIIVVASVTVFINQQIDINKLTQEKESLDVKLEQQLAENEELNAILEEGDEEMFIERIAREKFGYVKPGEKVFYDISANM